MKKIDLHLHTVSTKSEAPFSFDLAKLKEWGCPVSVDGLGLGGYATPKRFLSYTIGDT
jgi:hypothetical protein